MRRASLALSVASLLIVALEPATAVAEPVCGTVADFNTAMATGGTVASEVTLTYDLVGVNPSDFPEGKGSIAQFLNSACATGQDAVLKVYGTSDPLNKAHPPGTLKLEHGNSCCPGDCGEQWVEPNASAVIFVDGTETCNVTMWMSPTEIGYTLACSNGTFEGLGENPLGNAISQIAILEYFLPDGGTTWELPNATAMNDEVCWESVPSDMMTITVPVLEDVTVGPSWPDAVFPEVTDLAVESDGTSAYLKFEVPAIDGKITEARLSMHTSTAPSSDGDGGEVHVVMDSAWSEGTLTWNARPAQEAASLGRIGPGAGDVTLSLDLGTAISTSGMHSFSVFSPPTDGNGTHFWSKEGSAELAASLTVSYVIVDGDMDGTNDGPDCNDADPAINPDADEACNGVDDNCDGETDEGCAGGGDSGGDGGATDGSGSGADETGLGSDGSGGGPGLPGFGEEGDGAGCSCTSSPRRRIGGFAFVVIALGLVRRRRS